MSALEILNQTSLKIIFHLEISVLFVRVCEGMCERPAAALALQAPLREVQVAPWGKSKAIALDSALHLMKRACREAVRQGLWAAGRSDSGEIYGTS